MTHLPFGKIVATPTPTNWCQAYGAGGLFLTLSLTSKTTAHPEHLGAIGKKIINDLEAEYFSLEEKSLISLTGAIEKAFAQIPEGISLSASICVLKDTILYVFLLGDGAILLKRGTSLGILLQKTGQHTNGLESASGQLNQADLVVLITKEFQELISHDTLKNALESNDAEDIAESLSPLIHGKEDGGSAAIFFTFTNLKTTPSSDEKEDDEEISTPPQNPNALESTAKIERPETTPPLITSQPFPTTDTTFPHPSSFEPKEKRKSIRLLPISLKLRHLSHRQRLLLSIASLLIIVLFVSIIYTTKQSQEKKAKEIFANTYERAQTYLSEGNGVADMNIAGARDSYQKAKEIVDKAETDIPKGTPEEKKLYTLQDEINSAIAKASGDNASSLHPAADNTSKLLSQLIKKNALYAAKDDDNIYTLSTKTVDQIPNDSGIAKTVIENDGDWTNPVGLGTFLGNLYVLDKEKGILKFVKGSSGYGASTSYLTASKPDFSKAVSLTIDSSIYVLFSNGEIAKFTKGSADTFSLSGLQTPLKNPTRIFTLPDFSSVYVLDNGNGRIVELSTKGEYKAQYGTNALKKASDFEVNQGSKTAYLLIDGKIYSMDLK